MITSVASMHVLTWYIFVTGMLVDLSAAIKQVAVSVATVQLDVSGAHMQLTVSAANMWVTIFVVIMQRGVSVAIMQVVFSAVHYVHDCCFVGDSFKYFIFLTDSLFS